MAANNKDGKAMDVAKPGKAVPDTTARPVIITHRPMVQDPTVKTDDKAGEPTSDEASESPKTKASTGTHGDKVIQPVSESLDTAEVSKSEETEEKPPADTEASAEAAVVEAVAEQAESGNKKNGQQTEEDKAKQEHLQKLITDKTYFVKVGQVARRRNRRLSIALLIVLVVAVGAYLAIDAKAVPITVKLPVELIKN